MCVNRHENGGEKNTQKNRNSVQCLVFQFTHPALNKFKLINISRLSTHCVSTFSGLYQIYTTPFAWSLSTWATTFFQSSSFSCKGATRLSSIELQNTVPYKGRYVQLSQGDKNNTLKMAVIITDIFYVNCNSTKDDYFKKKADH